MRGAFGTESSPTLWVDSDNPAFELKDDALVLWAESPAEARNFLDRVADQGKELSVERIFVAKRSPNHRSNKYVGGDYYSTSDDFAVDVNDQVISAPHSITALVQWCTCDVMLSRGSRPLVALEDTTHVVRMNLYQRIPRLARAASLGVPSVLLQGTRGLDFARRGDRWALHRYLQAFEAISRLYPQSPSLPLIYTPAEGNELEAQNFMVEHLSALVLGDRELVEKQRADVLSKIRTTLENGVYGAVPPDLPSVDYEGGEVIVRVGARPDRDSWHKKGSGQMDPYLGLILAAKYIYCYDKKGKQVKPLVVEFTHLPPGFWFFNNPHTTALYKRLPIEFADEVRFLGTH